MYQNRPPVADGRTNSLESPAALRTLSDEELADKLAQGCDDALAILYERYAPSTLGLARRVIGDLSEAEDTVQQVFFELHRSAGRLGAVTGSVRSWLHSRGFQRALNKREHLNSRGFYKSVGLEHVEAEVLRQSAAQSQFFPSELACLVDELLAQLSNLEREVIKLYLYERLSMAEIATQLKKTYAVVRHKFYNGLRKMRALLDERECHRKAEVSGE